MKRTYISILSLLVFIAFSCRSHNVERQAESTITESWKEQVNKKDSNYISSSWQSAERQEEGDVFHELAYTHGDTIFKTRYLLRWINRDIVKKNDTMRHSVTILDTIRLHNQVTATREAERTRSPTRSNTVAFVGWGLFLVTLLILYFRHR